MRFPCRLPALVGRVSVLYSYLYMYNMRDDQMNAIPYTHARNHLAETMEKVCDDHAPVIITRKNRELRRHDLS